MAIDEAHLGTRVRPKLLKQAIVMYQANRRQGSAAGKSRGMVQGSTRKIFRQKGTGNARMGAIRNPVRRGGGQTFFKRPRDFRQRMPKRMRRLAARTPSSPKYSLKTYSFLRTFRSTDPRPKSFNRFSVPSESRAVVSWRWKLRARYFISPARTSRGRTCVPWRNSMATTCFVEKSWCSPRRHSRRSLLESPASTLSS